MMEEKSSGQRIAALAEQVQARRAGHQKGGRNASSIEDALDPGFPEFAARQLVEHDEIDVFRPFLPLDGRAVGGGIKAQIRKRVEKLLGKSRLADLSGPAGGRFFSKDLFFYGPF